MVLKEHAFFRLLRNRRNSPGLREGNPQSWYVQPEAWALFHVQSAQIDGNTNRKVQYVNRDNYFIRYVLPNTLYCKLL
jgi:hypothetical protein